MQRISLILAGVAAAVILVRIVANRAKNMWRNSKTGDFKVSNIESSNAMKFTAADNITAVEPEKHFSLPEKLGVKYPGLKSFETKAPVVHR